MFMGFASIKLILGGEEGGEGRDETALAGVGITRGWRWEVGFHFFSPFSIYLTFSKTKVKKKVLYFHDYFPFKTNRTI